MAMGLRSVFDESTITYVDSTFFCKVLTGGFFSNKLVR